MPSGLPSRFTRHRLGMDTATQGWLAGTCRQALLGHQPGTAPRGQLAPTSRGYRVRGSLFPLLPPGTLFPVAPQGVVLCRADCDDWLTLTREKLLPSGDLPSGGCRLASGAVPHNNKV
ncbi:hypothetical protein E2C01_026429 [Portunus trituberculatus]|uniref:Uncharacterized protein n=1 Tax=Portunus trituberculatus TaxID=210409 RepID=A0A5B7EII9_PORTR|nr:hypothetical protein [Portunus trituberculatus]